MLLFGSGCVLLGSRTALLASYASTCDLLVCLYTLAAPNQLTHFTKDQNSEVAGLHFTAL